MAAFDLDDHIGAASAAGFDAISLRPSDVGHWLADGRTLDALRGSIDDARLTVAELDPVTGWACPQRDERGVALPDELRLHLEWAAVLGASNVTALVLPEEPWTSAADPRGLRTLVELADSASPSRSNRSRGPRSIGSPTPRTWWPQQVHRSRSAS